MNEQWKDVVGYDIYEVSNLGNIRNKKTGKILKPVHQPSGYTIVCLRKDGKNNTESVRRVVMNAFRPIQNSNKFDIIHKDNNKQNNELSNLQWVTRKYNIANNKSVSTELKCLKYMITNNVEKAIRDWNNMILAGKNIDSISIERAVKNTVNY